MNVYDMMDKERVASSHSSTGNWRNKGWVVSFIGIISLARIGHVSAMVNTQIRVI